MFALYKQTHGLTQQFYKPLDLYWYNYVSSYYGWRINPVTEQEQLHRGVDIAVPTGTTVYAAMDGTVTSESEGNRGSRGRTESVVPRCLVIQRSAVRMDVDFPEAEQWKWLCRLPEN